MKKFIIAVSLAATILAGCGSDHSNQTTAQKCIAQWAQEHPQPTRADREAEPAWLLKCARSFEQGK